MSYAWSRDNDGGYTIRSAVQDNPMLHANITALCLIETEFSLLSSEVLHCGNGNFRPFWLLWPWPWPDDLHIRTGPCRPWRHADVQIWTSIRQGFRKLSSDRHTYRQTDRHDENYYIRRFAGSNNSENWSILTELFEKWQGWRFHGIQFTCTYPLCSVVQHQFKTGRS